MPIARHRLKDWKTPVQGTQKVFWKTYYSTVLMGHDWDCSDFTEGFNHENGFYLTSKARFYPVINGTNGNYTWTNWPITGTYAPPDPVAQFDRPNFANVVARAVAFTNPSRPHVSLPTFVGEGRDLPKLFTMFPQIFRDVGRDFIRKRIAKVGNAYVGVEFGWRPFLSDLAKMLTIAKALKQRMLWLLQLASGRKIKRRMLLTQEVKKELDPYVCTQSAGVLMYHRKETTYKQNTWCTTRWALNPLTGFTMFDDMTWEKAWAYAHRLTLGVTTFGAFETMWELIPWSWLIDWFANIGGFLAANNNSLPVLLESVCWMARSSAQVNWTLANAIPSGVTLSGPYFQRTIVKERLALAHSPLASYFAPLVMIPVFTTGHMSIIAGLLAGRSGARTRRP